MKNKFIKDIVSNKLNNFTFILSALILVFGFGLNTQAKSKIETMCRFKAKEVAVTTYSTCITENKNKKIEKIRDSYKRDLEKLKNKYETALKKLSDGNGGGEVEKQKSAPPKFQIDPDSTEKSQEEMDSTSEISEGTIDAQEIVEVRE